MIANQDIPAPNAQLINRLLDIVENDIVPLTRKGVKQGNKIFGAALVNKKTLETHVADTNNEMENPLWHGEMHTLKSYYELPAEDRAPASELIFLSTHEPCSLCLSAITWCGFDNFFYLFSHEDSRDSFAIPHDLKILKEVFNVEPGGYSKDNEFWSCFDLQQLITIQPEDDQIALNRRADAITATYAELSNAYQSNKAANDIPLA